MTSNKHYALFDNLCIERYRGGRKLGKSVKHVGFLIYVALHGHSLHRADDSSVAIRQWA